MSDFNSVFSKVKHIVNAAGRGTSVAVEISKLNLKIMQVNTMLQSTYERIGTLYYEQERKGVNNSDKLTLCALEVDDMLLELADLGEKIAVLKRGVICPKCRTVNPTHSGYCSRCGANIAKATKPDDQAEEATFIVTFPPDND